MRSKKKREMEEEESEENHEPSYTQHYLYALQLASIWSLGILSLCCIITLIRNICLALRPPAMFASLKTSSTGPIQSTARTKDGTIVPVVNYFEEEKAKKIMKKRGKRSRRRERQRERRRRKRERRMMNRNVQEEDYADSMKLLEMQMLELEEEDEDEKIIECRCSDLSDQYNLLQVTNLPDILLSPTAATYQDRRLSTLSTTRRKSSAVGLSPPLIPPYLPSRPVSVLWSSTHNTDSLYRYTHMERVVYPPGYVSHI